MNMVNMILAAFSGGMGIVIAAAIVSGVGVLIGLFLGIAGKKLEIPVDEKEVAVRAELPGNNCGGCGYAGCDGLAAAIAAGKAPVGGCPVGGVAVASKIAAIMGVDADAGVRLAAYVKCAGNCDKAKDEYVYTGIEDCRMAAMVPDGGAKMCSYGCLGFGSCVSVCDFDAVHVINGVAVVDTDLCKACGKCVAACPKNLIELRPVMGVANVTCSSHDKGKPVMDACQAGCIGCTLCVKQCENGAIEMDNNIPVIDYNKCTGCGKCAEKCPKKVIHIA